MSITVSTDVFCDGCSQWDQAVTVTGPRTNAKGARKTARRRGWKSIGSQDYCPDCAPLHPKDPDDV